MRRKLMSTKNVSITQQKTVQTYLRFGFQILQGFNLKVWCWKFQLETLRWRLSTVFTNQEIWRLIPECFEIFKCSRIDFLTKDWLLKCPHCRLHKGMSMAYHWMKVRTFSSYWRYVISEKELNQNFWLQISDLYIFLFRV